MSIETMTKIATYTVGAGGIASYTFTNIRQDFTDLVIIGSVRTNRASTDEDGLAMAVNGLNTGYTYRGLTSNGSSASSINTSFEQPWFTRVPASTATANIFGNFKVYIPQYSKFMQKTYYVDGVQENNASIGYSNLMAITNTTTLPITTLEFRSATGATMQQHSTITIYGVKNSAQTVGNAIKATGGAISFDGTYVYHIFNSSGSFTPTQPLAIDALVVAGGGGGGYLAAGGGGAGGFLTFTSQSVSAAQTVIVGSGGAGGTNNIPGFNGSDSQLGSLTLVKGGGGGGSFQSAQRNGLSGGSGGGGSGGYNDVSPGGSPTSGQGFAGGNSSSGPESYSAGGGGGAGAVGGNATGNYTSNQIGGDGGIGLSTSISGGSTTGAGHLVSGIYYFAGGGGGAGRGYSGGREGYGGAGGGGNGGKESPTLSATNGMMNTGGGGGGPYNNGTSGRGVGGSGIVIIRYLAQ